MRKEGPREVGTDKPEGRGRLNEEGSEEERC